MARCFSLLVLLFSQTLFAHGTGHGAPIEGIGPRKGKLTAVVLAKDSELGEKAKTQAVAEWLETDNRFDIYFYRPDQKSKSSVKGDSEVKWILLGKTLEKPTVIKTSLLSNIDHLTQRFDAKDLKDVEKIEVILPNIEGHDEKAVFIFSR